MEDKHLALKSIKTPDFGGAAEVLVIELLVKPGDTIEIDTPVMTLESDKATMELPASEAGTIKEIKVKVGDKVSTGDVLLTLQASAEESQEKSVEKSEEKAPEKTPEKSKEKSKDTASKEKSSAKSAAAKKEAPEDASDDDDDEMEDDSDQDDDEDENEESEERKASSDSKPIHDQPHHDKKVLTGTVETDNDVHAGPGVRRMARELGVSLSGVVGTGPKRRILKNDIQKFVKSQLAQAQSSTGLSFPISPTVDFTQFGEITLKPLSRIKKISGKNLQRNWVMIPHVTQFGEADITSLEDFRIAQKAELEKQQIKLTPLVFVMKAVIASLKAFPQFNASLDPNGENLILKNYYHVGVAVDTPDGLVVPVVRDVDKKGLIDLAKELAIVSEKARKKQLMPADMQGGCFSVSSLGGIGGNAFTPIINAPEVAILGVSKASYKPVYENKTFVPKLMLPLSLSYDHRVIDGADGARFIMHLSKMLSDIRHILM